MPRESHAPTPFAVRCPYHGLVYLQREEYDRQMDDPDARWVCPRTGCGREASWDDDNYEERIAEWSE
jgi:hypothetical protein